MLKPENRNFTIGLIIVLGSAASVLYYALQVSMYRWHNLDLTLLRCLANNVSECSHIVTSLMCVKIGSWLMEQ